MPAPIQMSTKPKHKELVLLSTNAYWYLVMAFGAIPLVIMGGMWLAGIEVDQAKQPLVLRLALAGLFVIVMIVGFVLTRFPWVVMRLTDDGVYIGQYEKTFPWTAIEEIRYYDPLNDDDPLTRIIARKGKHTPTILLKFTEDGEREFGNLIWKSIQAKFEGFHAAPSTFMMRTDGPHGRSVPALLKEMEKRRSAAWEWNETAEVV